MFNLSAPTSGTYDGILIYQNPSNTNSMIFNGSGSSIIKGIFYLPTAQLTLNGSNQPRFTLLSLLVHYCLTAAGPCKTTLPLIQLLH